jgi:prepilin-type N-terminal cleavage/methylation domain-containing protein
MDSVKKSNLGFSLIELMIAMTVSLLILAGLFYSVIGDLRSYESTRSTQALVSKSRMAIQTMRLYIQQAGFRDVDALMNNTSFDSGTPSAGGAWVSSQVVYGMKSSSVISETKVNSDILVVRFMGAVDDGIVSCTGDDLTDETNTYEITLYVNTTNQLMCKDDAGTAVVLDENVEFIELLYGTEDDLQYFTASEVTDWTAINRIKVGLLLSEDVAGYGFKNNKSYTIFNQTIAAEDDTKYRTVVMDTVLIGNRG